MPECFIADSRAVQTQPLIAVRDVRAASGWCRDLLGAETLSDHAHRDIYDRVYVDGRMILQLHAWDEEEHPNLINREAAPLGHGVVLWFEIADFDAAVARARNLRVEIIEEPHINPAPQHREMWFRDPNGYVLVIASPDGETAEDGRSRVDT